MRALQVVINEMNCLARLTDLDPIEEPLTRQDIERIQARIQYNLRPEVLDYDINATRRDRTKRLNLLIDAQADLVIEYRELQQEN